MAASLVEMGFCSLRIFRNVKPNDFEITGGMVVFCTGPKGAGKTSLLAHLAGTQMLPEVAFDKVRIARAEAAALRAQGYKNAIIPDYVNHLVYSDIPIQTSKDQGYLPRYTWDLDVMRMQVPNAENGGKVQFEPYGAVKVIDELMEKFDARDFNKKDASMPVGMRKYLQICRHRGIAVITGCLLASGADKRFRQMSQNILLIVHRDDRFNKDKLTQTTWYCLEFGSAEACDKFLSNYQAEVSFTPRIFVHYGNIHDCVDSYLENNEFLAGMENSAFEFEGRGA